MLSLKLLVSQADRWWTPAARSEMLCQIENDLKGQFIQIVYDRVWREKSLFFQWNSCRSLWSCLLIFCFLPGGEELFFAPTEMGTLSSLDVQKCEQHQEKVKKKKYGEHSGANESKIGSPDLLKALRVKNLPRSWQHDFYFFMTKYL